jgi:hypothetical protein
MSFDVFNVVERVRGKLAKGQDEKEVRCQLPTGPGSTRPPRSFPRPPRLVSHQLACVTPSDTRGPPVLALTLPESPEAAGLLLPPSLHAVHGGPSLHGREYAIVAGPTSPTSGRRGLHVSAGPGERVRPCTWRPRKPGPGRRSYKSRAKSGQTLPQPHASCCQRISSLAAAAAARLAERS